MVTAAVTLTEIVRQSGWEAPQAPCLPMTGRGQKAPE